MRPRIALLSIVLLGLGFAMGQLAPELLVGRAGAQESASSAVAPTPEVPLDLTGDERRDIRIFREASASVAFITTKMRRRNIFSTNVTEIPQGNGSGFVWDRQGHVVTNYHVVQGGSSFDVTLGDETYPARVVGTAPDKDIAVLQVEAPAAKLVAMPRGKSSDLLVGQRVLAVGNPFGLDHSLTVGVVSALGRELTSPGGRVIRDVIQTDAAINPGNSGGPLLDSRGLLIGMNSAIYSPSGAFAGIGFAVPVDAVARMVPQLIKSGRPEQAGIGVSLIPDNYVRQARLQGAAVYEVVEGLPAAEAGIEGIGTVRGRVVFGDIVVAVDGKPVKNNDDLFYLFEAAGVGARVTLTLERDGKPREVPVQLVALE